MSRHLLIAALVTILGFACGVIVAYYDDCPSSDPECEVAAP